MGPNRKQYQLDLKSVRSQHGITAIGFLILATLVGIVGLGALKIVPIYLNNMRIDTVLDDLQQNYTVTERGASGIRLELESRLAVEGKRIPRENITIKQSRDFYELRIALENRQLFLGDIYFLVLYDRQVDIPR